MWLGTMLEDEHTILYPNRGCKSMHPVKDTPSYTIEMSLNPMIPRVLRVSICIDLKADAHTRVPEPGSHIFFRNFFTS
jgi:hypothetical protein